MITEFPPALVVATYAALLLSILGLWIRPGVWMLSGGAAVVLGYLSGVLTGPAALWIAALAALCVGYVRCRELPAGIVRGLLRGVLALGIAILAVLLGTHTLPGFNNLLVARKIVLSPGSAPYSLYLNFDKTTAGILILGILHGSLRASPREWAEALRKAAPVAGATIAVLIVASVAAGYLRVDPKWHALFLVWAPANLLLTCLSEEAFFRGFIQRELYLRFSGHRYAQWIAIGAGAVTFGAAHFAGGWTYVLLATLAGGGYGLVYARTGRIEMAMLTHFALNATHFLLFSYPRAV